MGLNALVTGATGFIGRRLVSRLCQEGWRVDVIVRSATDPADISRLKKLGCRTHKFDGSADSICAIVASVKPTCTWHLATDFKSSHSSQDIPSLINANIEYGTLLLEAIASECQSPAFVTAGTAWQQYNNSVYSPVALYAATKEAFSSITKYYADVLGVRVIECLLFDTYGPEDSRKKLLPLLIRALKHGVCLEMKSTGFQYIDLLHVDDVVTALTVAAKRAIYSEFGTAERWAVRSGHSLTVRDLVDVLSQVAGVVVPIKWSNEMARTREMLVPWVAGAVLPGWHPSVELRSGLRELIERS